MDITTLTTDLLGRVGLIGIILLAAALTYWLGVRVIRRTARSRLMAIRGPNAEKRLQTAATIMAHAWRYIVLFIAILAIIALFKEGQIPAVIFTSVAGVALGFGAQSFLKDLLAGVFMVFEGQFGVGDRVRLYGVDITGEVVEAGIRVTILRGESGDTFYVPNGSITAVNNLGPATAPSAADEPTGP